MLTFPAETASVNLTEIPFSNDFNVGVPLAIDHVPVYEKQTDGVYMITYIKKGVILMGDRVEIPGDADELHGVIADVVIPERKVAPPGVPEVEITAATSSTIHLAWDAVDTAVQYKVYRGDGTFITTTSDTAYVDMGLRPSTGYTYQVSAVNRGGEGAKSPALSQTTASDTLTLSEGTSQENTLSGGDVHYYQITVEAAYTYDVFWQDADTDSAYPADIQAGAKTDKASSSYLVTLTNPGNMISLEPSSNGSIFIEVRGVTAASSGRYAIRYTKRSREQEIALPSAPAGLQVAGNTTANTVSLTWNGVTGASYYKVYRNNTYQNQTTGLSYTDTGLNPSTDYTYQVSAVNSRGEGPKTSSVTGTTQAANSGENSAIPLYASVTTNRISAGITHYYTLYAEPSMQYVIRWSDKDTVYGYGDIQVGLKSQGASYYLVGVTDYGNTNARNEISFTPASAGTVIVVVQGYSSSGGNYGIWYSSQQRVSTPASPSNLRATTWSHNSITLAWDGVSGADSYKIYRNNTYLGTSSTTGYTDSTVRETTVYTYKVSAVNTAGESSRSNEASLMTDSSIRYTLPASASTRYSLSAGAVHEFSFSVTSGRRYTIQWHDSDDTHGRYADIQVGIKTRGTSSYFVGLTDYGNQIIFTPSSTGTVVVEVRGYDSSSDGYYYIWYQ